MKDPAIRSGRRATTTSILMLRRMIDEKNKKRNGWPVFESHGITLPIVVMGGTVIMSALVLQICGQLLARANVLGRICFQMPINNDDSHDYRRRKFRIAMVTLSDESDGIPERSFEGVMKAVEPNKRSYAEKHGYDFIDATNVLDRRRPPSWSKILAVRTHLPQYDWVFWNDAVQIFSCLYLVIGLEDCSEEKIAGFSSPPYAAEYPSPMEPYVVSESV